MSIAWMSKISMLLVTVSVGLFIEIKNADQKYKFWLNTWIKTLLFSLDEWWMKAKVLKSAKINGRLTDTGRI